MALTTKQLASLNNLHGLSLAKVICIGKAAGNAYKCIKAAGKDPSDIAACAATLVHDIESCLKK